MDRWIGKVAVVTGASTGIGAATVIDLLNAGLKVVGLARRQELIAALADHVKDEYRANLHARECDVGNEESVKECFRWVKATFGGVDILVSNAGCLRKANIVDADNTDSLRAVIDTNLWGTIYCVREAFQSMKDRGGYGHVVLINSILGHDVPFFVGRMASFNVYPASKHAITAMTEVLRQEFIEHQTKIKVTVRYSIFQWYMN